MTNNQIFVFVDNSNIFIESQKVYEDIHNDPDIGRRYRLDFGKLFNYIAKKRGEIFFDLHDVTYPKLYGSEPPKMDSLWKFLDKLGVNVKVFTRNAFNKETNKVKNQLTGEYGQVPDTARAYKKAGVYSIVVGDHNYGEGSSREHAAMEPRHLGVAAVIVKSFARIHETNLKKQGMLGLTFANENDYDLIKENDTFNFLDLDQFAPGKQLTLEIIHSDGSKDVIKLNHTYNDNQIEWFKEGSALNLIKKQNA